MQVVSSAAKHLTSEKCGKKTCNQCQVWLGSVSYFQFQGIFLFSVIKYQSVAYEGKEYPSWAEGLGWSIACCSMLCIPVTAANVLMNAEGSFFEVRVLQLITAILILEPAFVLSPANYVLLL